MLRGEDWYMVRDLLRSGVSLSEISRRTGFDRKTIRKLRDQPAHPPPLRRTRRRQIDPYAAHLTARAERGVLNATKLYAEIQQQGYPGGVAQVRRFVSSLRPRASVAVVTRFETLPGQQAQVDWSHCGALGPETDRDLADSYGFTPRACQPYRPQTKGKVERSIGYLKGNFLLGRELATETLATLNRAVLLWLRETADGRVHGTTQQRPCDRWPAEQAALQPLGSRPVFDTSVISQRLVSREATVAYKGGSYRVAVAYVGRVVVVKESEDGRVRLYSEGHCIGDLPLQQPRRPLRFPPRPHRSVTATSPTPVADAGSRLPWPEVERRSLAAYDAAAGGED
jgi:transposase